MTVELGAGSERRGAPPRQAGREAGRRPAPAALRAPAPPGRPPPAIRSPEVAPIVLRSGDARRAPRTLTADGRSGRGARPARPPRRRGPVPGDRAGRRRSRGRQDPARPRADRPAPRRHGRPRRPGRPRLARPPVRAAASTRSRPARRKDDERLALLADPDRPTDERVRLGLEVVRDLTARAPSVVVFDDLHWADSESVALFERLAEQGSGPRAARRYLPARRAAPPAPDRGDAAPARAPPRGHAPPPRSPLDVADVGSFLAAVYGREPSYRVVEALHARTGGNPFFLEELLAAAREDDPDELLRQELPWSLAELVRTQLDDLTRRAARGARDRGGARRHPRRLRPARRGLRATPRTSSSRILRHLVARGLLVEAEADVFSFRHALAREAIESDLLGRERRRLHQAALDALRATDSDDFAAIAHHAYGAGQFDDMVEAAARGRAALAALRFDLPGAAARRARAHRGVRRRRAARPREPGRLAERPAHRRPRLHAVAASSGPGASGDLEAESAALRLICRLDHDLGDAAATTTDTAALAELVERLDEGAEQARAFAVLAEMAHAARRPRRRDEVGRPRGRAGRPARPARGASPRRRSSAARRS